MNYDRVLSGLQGLLEQEEAALADLEWLVSEKRMILVDPDSRNVLDALPRIEEVLGRIGQLTAAGDCLARGVSADVGGPRFVGFGIPALALDPSESTRLLSTRQRILSLIARIAERNEANGHLIAGLMKVTDAAVDRFSQVQEQCASTLSAMTGESPSRRRQSALDVRV